MRLILDAAFAFIVLGVTEAFIKPLAKYTIERKVRKALPAVFKALDNYMPRMILQFSPSEIEDIVRHHLTEITGEDWSQRSVDLFFKLYDPRINAAIIKRPLEENRS